MLNSILGEEVKVPVLLPPLKEFEVAIVARFLSTRDKLISLASVNKAWNLLISKHYCWSRFPERGPLWLDSGFINFFDKITSLIGIDIPYFPAEFRTENRSARLTEA